MSGLGVRQCDRAWRLTVAENDPLELALLRSAGDAQDILNKAKGKKTGGSTKKKDDAMRQLAQQLLM
jgi:hypothetical protein